jgi:hypothetical protein
MSSTILITGERSVVYFGNKVSTILFYNIITIFYEGVRKNTPKEGGKRL